MSGEYLAEVFNAERTFKTRSGEISELSRKRSDKTDCEIYKRGFPCGVRKRNITAIRKYREVFEEEEEQHRHRHSAENAADKTRDGLFGAYGRTKFLAAYHTAEPVRESVCSHGKEHRKQHCIHRRISESQYPQYGIHEHEYRCEQILCAVSFGVGESEYQKCDKRAYAERKQKPHRTFTEEMFHKVKYWIGREHCENQRSSENFVSRFLHAEIHFARGYCEQNPNEEVDENVAYEIACGKQTDERCYEQNSRYRTFQHNLP